jgi:cobalt-zinc-cadmium efflux system outer membrane protein
MRSRTMSSVASIAQYCPGRARLRDARYRLYAQGRGSVLSHLEGQRQYNEVVRQYLDALIRHRRAMLRLNTAVGQRILP